MEDFEYGWDFGETVKLKEAVDLAKKSLEVVQILGDKDWKSHRAKVALMEIEELKMK
jgi:hypothetical protein